MEVETDTGLMYHGKAMEFAPARILCLQPGGPLDSDEPDGADILGLLRDGYSVFVEWQPGDGTRYGLILSPRLAGFSAMRVGAVGDGAIDVWPDEPVHPWACGVLAPYNAWSQELFAWWLNRLRTSEGR